PKEELTPDELRAAAVEAEAAGEDGRPFLIAWHERWAQALLPLAFCLLGTPLALGRRGGGRSGGRGFGFLLTLFAYVAYYVMVRGAARGARPRGGGAGGPSAGSAGRWWGPRRPPAPPDVSVARCAASGALLGVSPRRPAEGGAPRAAPLAGVVYSLAVEALNVA